MQPPSHGRSSFVEADYLKSGCSIRHADELCKKADVKMSPVLKRSVVIAGRKTSVSLEEEFWESIKEIAEFRGRTISELISAINAGNAQANLSSAVRLFVLTHYRDQLPPQLRP